MGVVLRLLMRQPAARQRLMVVFAMATTTRKATAMVQEAIQRFPDRLVPFAYALPSYERPVIDELEHAVRDLGFKGIKLHIGECSLAEYVSGPVFELAAENDVPCLIDFGGRLFVCRDVVGAHARTKFIVAHFGRYLSEDETLIDQFISLAEEHRNTLLDASGVVLRYKIEEAVDRIGAERILFGTDGPHSVKDGPAYQYAPDTVAFAQAAIDAIQSLRITPKDKAAILGENIANLLSL